MGDNKINIEPEEVTERQYYLNKLSKLPTLWLKEIWDEMSKPTAQQILNEVIE